MTLVHPYGKPTQANMTRMQDYPEFQDQLTFKFPNSEIQ